MDFKVLLKKDMKERQELVNIVLDRFLPRKDEYPKEIHKAIRYSLFAGGKRLRPYLTMLAYSLYKEDMEPIAPVAAAIEMIHTFSLIHDDLPDIDNDEYRRGKKSCHAVFGEGIALLAADALLVSAFELVTLADIPEAIRCRFVRELAHETGINGLIAGQMVDIESEDKKIDKKTLNFIHENKTGRLISICLRFGAIAGGASEKELACLEDYGKKIGLAFQIVDDLLDIEGDPSVVGKSLGKDEDQRKATFPSIYGVEQSRQMAQDLIEDAKTSVSKFGAKANLFIALADYILSRKS
jgi:geranylgeranyl diphosphate synthase type II